MNNPLNICRKITFVFTLCIVSLLFQSVPVKAYIPFLSEAFIAGAILSAVGSRSADRDRRRYSREDTSSLDVSTGQETKLSNDLKDYLGSDLNRAAKKLLTCIVDLAEADAKAPAVLDFLKKPPVLEFLKAHARTQVDFTPLANEMPFLELLKKMGDPNEVLRAHINKAIKNAGGNMQDIREAALQGRLNSEFLQKYFRNKTDQMMNIHALAVDFAAWAQISPRAMIMKGFDPEDQSEAEHIKETQKLEHSAKFLQAMLAVYTQFLSDERRQRMSAALLEAQEKKLELKDTIVLILKEVGPVVLKRLQEGDVASAELQEALRIFLENVPPMDWEKVHSIILADYHLRKLEDGFIEFEKTPIATGTVAQVHKAKVKVDGEIIDVAVKVWRPGFDEAVSEDLAILQRGKDIILKFINPKVFEDYVQNISYTLRQEGDPELEAKNIRQGRKVYHNPKAGISSLELVPIKGRSHTRYTLVTKFVKGKTLAKMDRKSQKDILTSMQKLTTVYTHWLNVLLDNKDTYAIPGFMHGDLHPGNIKSTGKQATFLDFGSTAKLLAHQSQGVALFLKGYVTQDSSVFLNGIDFIRGEGPQISTSLRKELDRAIKKELKGPAPMSEILEVISAKMVENDVHLFGSFVQLKRVIAQVENELRSLRTSYDAQFDDENDAKILERAMPLAIYKSVIARLAGAEDCGDLLK